MYFSMNIAWGTITWYFLHSLAEKIKEESFNDKKDDLMKIFFIICENLPCPECQEHAKSTMKNLKRNSIKTKDDFQKMIWSFHNMVNKRKRLPQFTFEQCKEKYESSNLTKIFDNFVIIWLKNYSIMKLMNESFKRRRCVDYLKKWMNENIQHF